jgi:hypothetical protein
VRPGKPKKKPVEKLHVRITPERVYVPRWRTLPDGRLADRPDMIEVKDLPTAIRHEVHKLRGERNANRRALNIRRSIEMIHSRVYERWKQMNSKEREETWRHLEQLHKALRGKRAISEIDSKDRKKAAERLDRLLELRKPGDIPATLVGVANDLTARRNALLPQMRFTRRMRDAIVERKTELDERAFRLLDMVSEHKSKVAKAPKKGAQKRELAEGLRQLKSELAGRHEPELRDDAAKHVGNAIEHLRKNKRGDARESLRKGARAIIASNAKYNWLYPSRMEQVAQSRSGKFREIIARRQLELFRDNLQYWHSRDSHEPLGPKDIRELLGKVGEMVPGSELQQTAREASELLRKRRVKAAKELLEERLG